MRDTIDKHLESLGKATDILTAIIKISGMIDDCNENRSEDPTNYNRYLRQRNILIDQYNSTVSGMDKIVKPAFVLPAPTDPIFIQTVFKSLTPRATNALKHYFALIVPVTNPGISDLREIDFDRFALIRNVGWGIRQEVELFVQKLF